MNFAGQTNSSFLSGSPLVRYLQPKVAHYYVFPDLMSGRPAVAETLSLPDVMISEIMISNIFGGPAGTAGAHFGASV